MPVFRKGKGKPAEDFKIAKRKQGKRVLVKKPLSYLREDTPLSGIERLLGFKIRAYLKRRAGKEGRPSRVLDWGCGKGEAVYKLAKELGEKIQAYGYSKQSYSAWNNKTEKVTFLQATKEELARYLKRIGGVDLIYESFAMMHIKTPEEFVGHICQLVPFLTKNGLIVFDTFHGATKTYIPKETFEKALKEKGLNVKVTRTKTRAYKSKQRPLVIRKL